MDRIEVYPGQILPETTLLQAAKDSMIGISKLAEAILGTGTLISGLACAQQTVPNMTVAVQPGMIYKLADTDATDYGSLGTDSTQIVQQGIITTITNLSCPAPSTGGNSINYLVQIGYTQADGGSEVLPYYNSANPNVAFNGPNNDGTPNNTRRFAQCIVSVKAGSQAPTGTQTTPAPDAGKVGAWVVTVANGDTSILNSAIAKYSSAPFISSTLTNLAPLASPAFTGVPTVPTAAAGNNSTQAASTAYADAAGNRAVVGTAKNLKGSAPGTGTVATFTWDELILENASGIYEVSRAGSYTVDTSATVGTLTGLDTGTLTSNTWYFVWAVSNGTTKGLILSASMTAPTPPAGYTSKACIGAVRTDSGTNLLSFKQVDRVWQYVVNAAGNVTALPLVTGGSSAQGNPADASIAFVNASLTTVLPNVGGTLFAKTINLSLSSTGGITGQAIVAPNSDYGGWDNISNPCPLVSTTSTSAQVLNIMGQLVPESANLSWAQTGNFYLRCVGFTF